MDGNVLAKEIKVKTDISVPDYVFEYDYKLLSLPDIEQYVRFNKHLPEIPKASEVEQNGVLLGEMDKMLLKKIEELTLHVISLQKQIDDLKMKR